jgi:cation transport regulator ChaB
VHTATVGVAIRTAGHTCTWKNREGEGDDVPKDEIDMPSTLERSPKKAQDTYAETLQHAEEEYDSESRAHRTAWGAVKHSFEKVGDHWEPKDEKGPSDEQSELTGAAARDQKGTSRGGVDENASKDHLMELAKKADIHGRSNMTEAELAEALQKSNDAETRKARSS